MKEIPGLVFLGRGVEELKGFTAVYLVIISAMLANIILNETHSFYQDKDLELTLRDIIYFVISPQGALVITVCALIVGAHYVLVPLVVNILAYLSWKGMVAAGNLFFFMIYLVFTKVLRFKAEKPFSLIWEKVLLDYIIYGLRICHYNKGRIVQNRHYSYYKWYASSILSPGSRDAFNVYLTTSILISTWAVIHHYQFFALAPALYYILTFTVLFYVGNAIVVTWIMNKPKYFLDYIANSISYMDSLKMQQNPE